MRRAGSWILFALVALSLAWSAEAAGRAVAVIVDVTGEVSVQRKGEDTALTAYVGMDLFEGDRLAAAGQAEVVAFYESGGTVKHEVSAGLVVAATAPVAKKPGVLSRLGSSLSDLFGTRKDVRNEEAGAVEAGLVMARVAEEELETSRKRERSSAGSLGRAAEDGAAPAPAPPVPPGDKLSSNARPPAGKEPEVAPQDAPANRATPAPALESAKLENTLFAPASPGARPPAPGAPSPAVPAGGSTSAGKLSKSAAPGRLREGTARAQQDAEGGRPGDLSGARDSRLDLKSGGGGGAAPVKPKPAWRDGKRRWLPGLTLDAALARARIGAADGTVPALTEAPLDGTARLSMAGGEQIAADLALTDGATLTLQVRPALRSGWSRSLTIAPAAEFDPVLKNSRALVADGQMGQLVAVRMLDQRGYRLAAYLVQRQALLQLRAQGRAPVVLKRLAHQVAERALELGDFETVALLKADL